MSSKRSKEVYSLVAKIPKGKVMTYGQVGKALSMNPRHVGRILHENTDPEGIPCHRVVNSRGRVAEKYAFGGGEIQARKLMAEDVEFAGKRVNLQKCLYKSNH